MKSSVEFRYFDELLKEEQLIANECIELLKFLFIKDKIKFEKAILFLLESNL